MPQKPPSMRAIIAFEATARHLSFTRAGEELELSQSAISYAIRNLETRLGSQLFLRCGRTILLTDEGRRFARRIRSGLSVISSAFEEAPEAPSRIVMGVPRGFAERFLVPRLGRFSELREGFELDLRVGGAPAGVVSGELDLLVRLGPGGLCGVDSQMIARETLVPAVAPTLDGGRNPRRLDVLARLPLIHQASLPWSLWLEQFGWEGLQTSPSIRADDLNLAVQLAIAGQGVVLAPSLAIQPDLQTRRLVPLFEGEACSAGGYFAAWNPDSPSLAQVRRMIDWLRSEIEAAGAPSWPRDLVAAGASH